jgi:hypothetical protein
MDESFLLKTAIIVAVLGLVILYILSGAELETSSIERINKEPLGGVRLVGKAVSVQSSEGYSRITLEECQTVDVVAYENLEVPLGSELEVVGRREDKDGKATVMADRIVIR